MPVDLERLGEHALGEHAQEWKGNMTHDIPNRGGLWKVWKEQFSCSSDSVNVTQEAKIQAKVWWNVGQGSPQPRKVRTKDN